MWPYQTNNPNWTSRFRTDASTQSEKRLALLRNSHPNVTQPQLRSLPQPPVSSGIVTSEEELEYENHPRYVVSNGVSKGQTRRRRGSLASSSSPSSAGSMSKKSEQDKTSIDSSGKDSDSMQLGFNSYGYLGYESLNSLDS